MADTIRIDILVRRGNKTARVVSSQPLHLPGDLRRHRKAIADYINKLSESVSHALQLPEGEE